MINNPKSVVLNGFNKKKVDVSFTGDINLKNITNKEKQSLYEVTFLYLTSFY